MARVYNLILTGACCLWLSFPAHVNAQDNFRVEYEVTEEQPVGTVLGNLITDTGLDNHHSSAVLPELRFDFMPQSETFRPYFRIGDNGELATSALLDRDVLCSSHENPCHLDLDLAIQPMQYFDIVQVSLLLADINDNSPQFPVPRHEVQVSETALPGAQFVLPVASDADSTGYSVQTYELEPRDGVFDLKVTQNPGGVEDVTLILKERLDREGQHEYVYTLLAYDGGQRSGSMSITIKVLDANDNPPEFDNDAYEVTVKEDISVGYTFLQVHATDPDEGDNSHVSYSLSSSTDSAIAALFAVHPTSGAIYTLAELDHETADVYFLSVQAQDSGATSSLSAYTKVKVIIEDVNDHPPHISINALPGQQGRVRVLENAPAGTFVAHVSVQDPDEGDNGLFGCTLDTPYFELRPLERTEFKILTKETFDREVRDTYRLQLTCRDLGLPAQISTEHVVVDVVDINDHTPVFSKPKYSLSVVENNQANSYVGQINASDRDTGDNAQMVYSIQLLTQSTKLAEDILKLDPSSGLLTAADVFDHEDETSYTFLITVTDKGEPRRSSTATLTLDVMDINDCAPQFGQKLYTFATFENQPEGTEIGTLTAFDADSPPYNDITYNLDQNFPDSVFFDIDPRSGRLISKKSLDREVQHEYRLKVLASNEGLMGSTNITLHVADKNDNAPIITWPTDDNNTVDVSTLTPSGKAVTHIEAHDIDLGTNAALTFSIVSGDENGLFDIHPMVGEITTTKDLSPHGDTMLSLVILVQDQGTPPLSSVCQLNFYLNDTLALIAQSQTMAGVSDQTAVLIICLLVFTITIITVVLFVLLLRRKYCLKGNTKTSQAYNCRLEAEARTPGPQDQDSNAKNTVDTTYTVENNKYSNKPPWTGSMDPVVIENPQAHSTFLEQSQDAPCQGKQHQPSRKRGSEPRQNKGATGTCALREVQLQVHDLLQPRHARRDPDSDSLTDSGKGPSEEGDGHTRPSPGSDTTDDSIQPPLPPRRPKLPCKGVGHQPAQQPQQPHQPQGQPFGQYGRPQPAPHGGAPRRYTPVPIPMSQLAGKDNPADYNSWPRNGNGSVPQRNKSECVRPKDNGPVPKYQAASGVAGDRQGPRSSGPYHENQPTPQYSDVSKCPRHRQLQQQGRQSPYSPVNQPSHPYQHQSSLPVPSPYHHVHGRHEEECSDTEGGSGDDMSDDGSTTTSGSFMVDLEDSGQQRDIYV